MSAESPPQYPFICGCCRGRNLFWATLTQAFWTGNSEPPMHSDRNTDMNPYHKKILNRKTAAAIMANLRNSGKKTVFTNGCFDILHAGHIKLLASAKNLGDFLVVGLNSDKSVKRIKGPHRPLNTEKDRAAVLSGLESVDAIVLFGQDTPLQLIKLLRPAILVKGADYGRNEIIGSA